VESTGHLKKIKGAIFDLDGVIVDTAKYHYLAWKRLAKELGFDFSEKDNERLKGVSRIESLELLLEIGGLKFSPELMEAVANVKNNWYIQYISSMDESEILKGAREYILSLRERGVKIALGSASKNAQTLLGNLHIYSLFDAIVDGNKLTKSKPDPEIFLLGAKALGLEPAQCAVFEDAFAGVEAAKRGRMYAVGIGNSEDLPNADITVKGLYELIG
jgi:beta-phosphoglucomutase